MTHNKFVLASGSEIHEAESMLDEIVNSKISKTDFEMYQQHFRNEMGIENLFSDIDSESEQRHSVHEPIFSHKNNKNKLGCVVRMVIDSILFHAECEPNDHRKDAPLFTV